MADEMARIALLRSQGFHCSQILLILGLERQGRSNPGLVRAMNGLANGLGDCGRVCGVLTGAACLLGLYAGRGEVEEQENHLLNVMIQNLVEWFEDKFGRTFGGTDCQTILHDDPWNKMLRCPQMVIETYQKTLELLEDNRFLPPRQPGDG